MLFKISLCDHARYFVQDLLEQAQAQAQAQAHTISAVRRGNRLRRH